MSRCGGWSGSSWVRGCVALLPSVLWVVSGSGCESDHEFFDVVTDDGGGTGEDAGADAADAPEEDSGGPVTEHDCGSAGGVTVTGTIRFDGAVPGPARLYASWMASATTMGMPLCYVEIVPAAFPARFRFTGVERGATWAFVSFLDIDGGAIPYPAAGDYLGAIPEGTLDLSSDVAGVEVTLAPYSP